MLLNNSKYFLGVIHNSLVSIFLATLQCDKFYEILRFAQNDKVRHSKCFFPRNLLNGAHNDQVCHPEVKPNVLGSYEILHQVGVRNKRHRSHLQRKLNVFVDACSSFTLFVSLLTPVQDDGVEKPWYNKFVILSEAKNLKNLPLLGRGCPKGRRGFDNTRTNKAAFTLAEVLITLGIIGVVAAMTIPNLITKYQEKVTITKLQQTYSILSQGFRRMIDENGTTDSWGNDSESRKAFMYETFQNYVKIAAKCTNGQNIPCLGKGRYSYNRAGTMLNSYPSNIFRDVYVLQNGVDMVVSFGGDCVQNTSMTNNGVSEFGSGSIYYGTYQHACGEIIVDINTGKTGPNKSDIDQFVFKIVTDGVLPAGTSKESVWLETFDNVCKKDNQYYLGRCTAWVLENKNMDYLRCPDELGWNKARRCSK